MTRASLSGLNIFISHPSPFLTDHEPNGDGLAAWEFASRLARRGHHIHIAAPAYSILKPYPPGLVIHPYRLRAPSAALHGLEALLNIRGIFKRLVRSFHFDLIHQLNPVYPGLSAGLLYSRVPLVLGPFEPAWPDPAPYSRGRVRRAWRWTFDQIIERANLAQERSAAVLILTTPAAVSVLCEPQRSGPRMRILPYGVDTLSFAPAPEGSTSYNPSVLFLANMYANKGIHTLLEAFEKVAVEVPRCCLVVAGDGPEADRVGRKIATMASRERIRMMGYVSRDRVAELMRSCDVYCLPSHGEPFGLTALEAMASGKPVVATDASGLGYIVDAPYGGRKVPVGDANALAEALTEILRSPSLRDSIGRHNRQLAVERYDWERVIDRLEVIYESVLTPSL